jgi:hypothetical protein
MMQWLPPPAPTSSRLRIVAGRTYSEPDPAIVELARAIARQLARENHQRAVAVMEERPTTIGYWPGPVPDDRG